MRFSKRRSQGKLIEKHRQMINCVEFIDQLTSLIFHLETKQLPNLIIESLVKKDHDGFQHLSNKATV
ncbi:MAG: hypothetical protein EBT51_10425 [Flavobacteriaceae bacterium]|jgi:hypothetical protein|nr:hypothetical protein [Flavobacteriaceae bacterium]